MDVKYFDHMKNFRSSIVLVSVGKIVITDTLHTSILAFLLHKPYVYLDQSYGRTRASSLYPLSGQGQDEI